MISYTAEVKCKSWLEHSSESSTAIQTPIEHSQISMKRKFLTWFLTLPKSSVKVELEYLREVGIPVRRSTWADRDSSQQALVVNSIQFRADGFTQQVFGNTWAHEKPRGVELDARYRQKTSSDRIYWKFLFHQEKLILNVTKLNRFFVIHH